jgi:hypothetical protein
MHRGSCVLWGCSALPVILPQSPHLFQNGCLSVLSSTGETEKYDGWRMTVMFFLVRNSLVKNEVCEGGFVMMQEPVLWRQNRIRPDTWLKIKGRFFNQYAHPAAWNFVHWLQQYASTIIYHSISLLQLLYRWQHQSRKLWIPHGLKKKNCIFRNNYWGVFF